MSDEAEDMRGPVMLAATNMLKPPPAVIGSINKEITLPRTIKLTTLLAVGVGAVLGFVASLFVFGVGMNALIYGPTVGGMVGWALVSFSPLRGESLAMWFGLQANSARKRKLVIDGRQVRLYVGIAPLRRTAAGTIRILPGGVPIDGARWDERGVPQQEIPNMTRLPVAPRSQGRPLTASTELSSQPRRKRRK
ncbi:hypothetical protein GCM10023195_58380 [Actinoallomurus liliacearum]|uniref:PrgI family protein n=1 Tax=Actinoallomurus liliacearum TaxID=1080073 RepID=A0ABP8TSY3_9ACTN